MGKWEDKSRSVVLTADCKTKILFDRVLPPCLFAFPMSAVMHAITNFICHLHQLSKPTKTLVICPFSPKEFVFLLVSPFPPQNLSFPSRNCLYIWVQIKPSMSSVLWELRPVCIVQNFHSRDWCSIPSPNTFTFFFFAKKTISGGKGANDKKDKIWGGRQLTNKISWASLAFSSINWSIWLAVHSIDWSICAIAIRSSHMSKLKVTYLHQRLLTLLMLRLLISSSVEASLMLCNTF